MAIISWAVPDSTFELLWTNALPVGCEAVWPLTVYKLINLKYCQGLTEIHPFDMCTFSTQGNHPATMTKF